MVLDNIDLNIWDHLGYITEYEWEGWVISPYTIEKEGDGFGSGTELPEHNIVLTKPEARRLTLGVSKAEGGDYTPDSDFWMDMATFFMVYRDIPKRVEQELKGLLDVLDNIADTRYQNFIEGQVH